MGEIIAQVFEQVSTFMCSRAIFEQCEVNK